LPDSAAPLGADPRLRDAMTGAGTSVWEWHTASDRLSDLDEGTAMLGYGPGEVESTQDAWTALMHADDRADNEIAYQLHARGQTEVYLREVY